MNSIKSFSCQKIWLIITFISLVSCKKQADISPNQTILKNENAFFYREKVSPSANEKDLVDTIINFCKKGDSTAHFSNKIIAKYGYPQWNLALPISNANGLKSLFIPVVDTGSRVQLIIFAYQDSRKHVIFKFIDRNTEQTQLPKASADSRIFCKESLTGIFGALDKSVAAARIPKNSAMENIKSNGTYVTSLCWSKSVIYGDGSLEVWNTQCSYQIFITPGISRNSGLPDALIGVYEDIQVVGDGGGGFQEDNDPVDEIINEMKNDCLKTILSEVTNTKLKSLIATLFNSTFGGTPGNFTIKFIENPNILTDNGLYPRQARGYAIISQNIWVIEMNPKFAPISAKESIAAALIHEIVHSFLSLYKEFRGGQASSILTDFQAHSLIYKEWIDKIRDILIEVYGMGSRNAVALAGYAIADVLFKENVPIKEYNDFLIDKYKVSVKDCNEVGELYEKGEFGEKCK